MRRLLFVCEGDAQWGLKEKGNIVYNDKGKKSQHKIKRASKGKIGKGSCKMEIMPMEQKMDRTMTEALKGAAIVLMVIHHCFGFPNWYLDGISYAHWTFLGQSLDQWICVPTKICVALFAFLSGWLYERKGSFSFRYSWKKILALLQAYWLQLFLCFLPLSIALGTYRPNMWSLWENLWAIRDNIVLFAWYVYFYIFAMLLLPLIRRYCMGRGKCMDAFLPLVLCVAARYAVQTLPIEQYLLDALDNCLRYFPCLLSGIWFRRYGYPRRWELFCAKQKTVFFVFFLAVIYLAKKEVPQIGMLNLEIIYAPFAVFALVCLFSACRERSRAIWRFLGRYSLQIWFFHSIFFSPYTAILTQKIAFLPYFPPLVVLWVLILCIVPAIFFAEVGKWIHKLIC